LTSAYFYEYHKVLSKVDTNLWKHQVTPRKSNVISRHYNAFWRNLTGWRKPNPATTLLCKTSAFLSICHRPYEEEIYFNNSEEFSHGKSACFY
jgi:hypothetical protein